MITLKLKRLSILFLISLLLILLLPSCRKTTGDNSHERTNSPEQTQQSADTGETSTYESIDPTANDTPSESSDNPDTETPYLPETKTLEEELAEAPAAEDPKYPFIKFYTIEKTLKLNTGETVQEIQFKIPLFTEDSEAAEKNNKIIMKIADNEFKTAQMYYNTIIQSKDARKSIRDKSTAFLSGYSIIYEVTFANDDIVDILLSGYEYTGGAHGMPWRKNLMLNPKEGGNMTLKDLYPDNLDSVLEIRNKAFEDMVKNSTDNEYFDSALDTIKKNTKDDGNYYLTEQGIVFYYPPYDLGPYARGYVEALVPYTDLPQTTYLN